MSQSIALSARLPQPQGTSITAPQWRVLCEAIFPGAKTSGAIQLALDYCAARKLDPFKRPVHIVPMYSKLLKKEVETVWPGINELQVTASRTGQWAGMDEPRWGPMITRTFKGTFTDERAQSSSTREITVTYPEFCVVTVYRMAGGDKHPFAEPVYWEEAYARIGRTELPNEMWQKRVRGQLHKCAKAASLRAAFPEEVGSDYASEEMEGRDIEAGGVTIHGTAVAMADPPIEQETDAEVRYPTLHGIGDGKTWISNLAATLAKAVDLTNIEEIEGLPVVIDALAKWPPAAKSQIKALFAGARARFEKKPDLLADLRKEADGPLTPAEIDAILARRDVQKAQDTFKGDDKAVLDGLIAELVSRANVAETSAPADEEVT